MDYKDLRSIQETYNAMYTEGYETSPNRDLLVPKSHNERMKDAKEKSKREGVFLPPWIGPELPRVKSKSTTQMAGYEPEGEMTESLAGMVDKATKAAQGGLERMGVKINRGPKPTARPSVKTQDTIRKNQSSMEEVDVFDIVKGHLMNEHNLSEDVALHLMTILDEEIKVDILEYNAEMRADAAPKGTTVKMTATGKEPVGDKILRGIKDRVGGFLRNLNPNALKSKTVEPRKPLVAIPKNESYVVTNADKKGNTPAYQNYLKGMKNKKTGEPLYKAAPHLKGV